MTDPGMNAVEQQIRQAQERGAFDNLPGAGKPLNLGRTDDPDWWVKGLIERERLDLSGALPSAAQLRKEAESYPASLVDVVREEAVREILEDFNRRVKQDRLRPAVGNAPQIIAPTVDVDDMVRQWALLRRERAAARRAGRPEPEPRPRRVERRWWRRGR